MEQGLIKKSGSTLLNYLNGDILILCVRDSMNYKHWTLEMCIRDRHITIPIHIKLQTHLGNKIIK